MVVHIVLFYISTKPHVEIQSQDLTILVAVTADHLACSIASSLIPRSPKLGVEN